MREITRSNPVDKCSTPSLWAAVWTSGIISQTDKAETRKSRHWTSLQRAG